MYTNKFFHLRVAEQTDMINIGPVLPSRSFCHSCFCLETPKKWTFSNGKSALEGAYGWKMGYD